MNLLFLHCTPSHPTLHFTTVSCFFRAPKTSTPILRTTTTPVPARDRVIDFGKHKGKMLGTVPSNYLKWVSKNLRARDFEEWAKLADQVLEDPVYRDRIEWEFAERFLNGDVLPNSSLSRSDQSAVSELLEISERFGWDNEDKVGWSKIDFGLLGSSKGGRIPRVPENGRLERESRLRREKARVFPHGEKVRGTGERREERREKLRLKRSTDLQLQQQMERNRTMRLGIEGKGKDSFDEEEEEEEEEEADEMRFEKHQEINQDPTEIRSRGPFPGREALLQKVLTRTRRL